jgi:hypothetical protein
MASRPELLRGMIALVLALIPAAGPANNIALAG